jgi:Fe2+ or Zn2+ uptake regulation protein
MKNAAIHKTLKEKGHKMTAVRRMLIEVFTEGGAPLTVQDLMRRLAKAGTAADKTTVYREVAFLLGQDVIQQVQFGDRVKRYEIRGDHHHHVICTVCRTITDVPLENDLKDHEAMVGKLTGYAIVSHSLEFFGICPDCR